LVLCQLAAEFTRLTNKRLDLWTELDMVIDKLIEEGKGKKGKYMARLHTESQALIKDQVSVV
jgi:hypothetical protein